MYSYKDYVAFFIIYNIFININTVNVNTKSIYVISVLSHRFPPLPPPRPNDHSSPCRIAPKRNLARPSSRRAMQIRRRPRNTPIAKRRRHRRRRRRDKTTIAAAAAGLPECREHTRSYTSYIRILRITITRSNR